MKYKQIRGILFFCFTYKLFIFQRFEPNLTRINSTSFEYLTRESIFRKTVWWLANTASQHGKPYSVCILCQKKCESWCGFRCRLICVIITIWCTYTLTIYEKLQVLINVFYPDKESGRGGVKRQWLLNNSFFNFFSWFVWCFHIYNLDN